MKNIVHQTRLPLYKNILHYSYILMKFPELYDNHNNLGSKNGLWLWQKDNQDMCSLRAMK